MDWTKAANRLSTELPTFIISTMTNLATVWPESYLGGGAVRDMLLGKTVRDWDFYLPLHVAKDSDPSEMVNILKRLLFPSWKVWQDFETEEKDDVYSDRFIVLKGQSGGYFADFIFSGQKIEEFDHAICQCSLNCKDLELNTTKWFDQCVADKIHRIFTYNLPNAASTHKSIHAHTRRIQAKYPWPIFLETGAKYSYVEH